MLAAGKLQNLQDPLLAKAMAIANALKIVDDPDMGKIIVETDCINLRNSFIEEVLANGMNAVVIK